MNEFESTRPGKPWRVDFVFGRGLNRITTTALLDDLKMAARA
jgi:hypothetical protein